MNQAPKSEKNNLPKVKKSSIFGNLFKNKSPSKPSPIMEPKKPDIMKNSLFTKKNSLNNKVLGKKSPKKNKNLKLRLGIFIFLLVIVGTGVGVYFLVTKKSDSDEPTKPSIEQITEPPTESELELPTIPPEPTEPPSEDEVYSTTKNIWTYDDAEAVCKSQGSELASYDQLVKSAEDGAHWCNLGWVKSDTSDNSDPHKYAHFPVQKDKYKEVKNSTNKDACGKLLNDKYKDKDYSLQGGAYNKNKLLAVNCYGQKREPKIDELDYMNQIKAGTTSHELENKMLEIQDLTDNMSFYPFNSSEWSALTK